MTTARPIAPPTAPCIQCGLPVTGFWHFAAGEWIAVVLDLCSDACLDEYIHADTPPYP